jgi:hypothetical protein
MNLNALHTFSGLMIVFCFLTKIGIQAYIDYRHARLGSLMEEVLFFSKYILPYRAEVKPEFKRARYLCNLFLRLAVVSFIVNAVVGVLILLWFGLNPVLGRS